MTTEMQQLNGLKDVFILTMYPKNIGGERFCVYVDQTFTAAHALRFVEGLGTVERFKPATKRHAGELVCTLTDDQDLRSRFVRKADRSLQIYAAVAMAGEKVYVLVKKEGFVFGDVFKQQEIYHRDRVFGTVRKFENV